jgi:putative tricarboxylic transport membrane protein
MRTNLAGVRFTGGSAGGVDHVLAGMIALQLRQDVTQLKYLPTSSGPEAAALLEKAQAQVAISSYSEFQTGIEKNELTPLAMSSRRALYGVPSLHEQGLQTDLSNWRAVFAPGRIDAAQRENLRRIVVLATQHPAWAQALEKNKWFNALLHGQDFAGRLVIEQGMASAMAMMLKLKA